jgi:hypothetical protein
MSSHAVQLGQLPQIVCMKPESMARPLGDVDVQNSLDITYLPPTVITCALVNLRRSGDLRNMP